MSSAVKLPRWIPSLALSLAGLTVSCGSDSPPGLRKLTRTERLTREAAALDVALERMRASGLDEIVLNTAEGLLVSPDPWFEHDGWTIFSKTLASHVAWNRPLEAGRPVFAVDFAEPMHPLHAIRSYADELARHDIELLVVPVPTRHAVFPDRIPGVPRQAGAFAGHDTATTAFLRALVAANVEILDLLPILARVRDSSEDQDRDPLFLDRDTHWAPRAAEIAARAITDRLEEMAAFERGPARAGREFEIRREPGEWAVYGPHDPPPERVVFRRVLDLEGERAHENLRESPILLLGDSFSSNFRPQSSDLVSLLFAHTGHQLDVICMSAGASSVWPAVARRGDHLAGKRIVVWVFTVTALKASQFRRVRLFVD